MSLYIFGAAADAGYATLHATLHVLLVISKLERLHHPLSGINLAKLDIAFREYK